ncbi:hypothetical protein ABH931_005224 [Streptacidiphilus sp. MAP12-33]|uniref:hypothetical protein n=1 Tax=Streptacidiphilus sp. MAP12-33 TaxID=3156266 RepID=UPI003515B4F5
MAGESIKLGPVGDPVKMTLWWSAALIAAGATVGVGMVGSALGAWREEQAGRVYELTPRYLRVAGRALVAAVALVGAAVGGVVAAVGDGGRGGAPAAVAVTAAGRVSPSVAAHPDSDRAHKAAPSAPAALTLVGQPQGGRLYQGTVPGVAGRVRVWVPSQYAAHSAASTIALQALVVRAPAGELAEVWEGLAGAVLAGHANPFVAVVPDDPCAAAADDTALRHAVAAQFRVASRPRSWAELGVDTGSACAVTAELNHPDVYAGAAALGGALPHPAASRGSGQAPGVRLLLAQAHRDTTGQAEAGRLRTALQGAPDAAVRLSSVVRDLTAGRERFRLVRLAADYVTEEFAAAVRR